MTMYIYFISSNRIKLFIGLKGVNSFMLNFLFLIILLHLFIYMVSTLSGRWENVRKLWRKKWDFPEMSGKVRNMSGMSGKLGSKFEWTPWFMNYALVLRVRTLLIVISSNSNWMEAQKGLIIIFLCSHKIDC